MNRIIVHFYAYVIVRPDTKHKIIHAIFLYFIG